MKATATTVLKLVQGSKVFMIPTFQRRYTWKKEQWSQLWSDVLNESSIQHPDDPEALHGHFLGSVVLHPALGPASTLMRHQVIDGQQRLTTILILLAALRDVRGVADPGWNQSAIDDQYLRNPFSTDYPERLIPTKLDRESYRMTIREGVPTGDIGIAYNYFKTEIERAHAMGVDLGTLETTILLHMLIVEITTKTGDSVNSIFNTLNSKGLDLSPADLVRNEVLHHIGDADAEAAHDRYWIPMEEALVKSRTKSPDREFVTFLWAREVALNPKTSRDELFPTFERRLRDGVAGLSPTQSKEHALAQLREIYEDHLLFLIVRDPDLAKNDHRISDNLRGALRSLNEWRSEPVTPIALWILKDAVAGKSDQDDAAEALRVLMSYLVKRILNGIPTNQLNRLLTPVASELRQSGESQSNASKMRTILSKQGYYWPTDEQVLASVATNPIYAAARRYVKFLLAIAERELPGNESANLSRSQIDHVMPQSLSAGWREDLERAGVDLADAESLTHTLGNLTLTDNNQRMGNAAFSVKKREFFEDSALRLNRSLSALDKFTPAEITDRSVNLARLLLRHFSYTPVSTRADFNGAEAGSSVEERLESLLQSLPVDRWITEEALIAVLGATPEQIRNITRQLDPTLARLIRDDHGGVLRWLPEDVAAAVVRQDAAQGGIGTPMSPSELNDFAAAANASDEAGDEDASDETSAS